MLINESFLEQCIRELIVRTRGGHNMECFVMSSIVLTPYCIYMIHGLDIPVWVLVESVNMWSYLSLSETKCLLPGLDCIARNLLFLRFLITSLVPIFTLCIYPYIEPKSWEGENCSLLPLSSIHYPFPRMSHSSFRALINLKLSQATRMNVQYWSDWLERRLNFWFRGWLFLFGFRTSVDMLRYFAQFHLIKPYLNLASDIITHSISFRQLLVNIKSHDVSRKHRF